MSGLIPEHNLLNGLPPELKAHVLSAARLRKYAGGALIHLAGDDPGCVSLIQTGQVRMSNVGRDGERVTLADLGPGESFGLVPFLSECPRTHDAYALTAVSLLEVRRAAFNRLMDEVPGLRDYVISELARRLMRALEAVEGERRYPLKVRLAKLILQKAEGKHVLRTTQASLADELGVSRYGVGLAVRELVAKGLIQTAYGEIQICNRARLSDFLG